ncbi:hypothetical protein PI126_g3988 [Phytophthora idaei]|nr:hypothetical protein PI126_g3988 [Phytophthora idaei]
MGLGDAVLGQITSVLVFVFGYIIPAVHSVVSGRQTSVPSFRSGAGNVRPTSKGKMLASQPHA